MRRITLLMFSQQHHNHEILSVGNYRLYVGIETSIHSMLKPVLPPSFFFPKGNDSSKYGQRAFLFPQFRFHVVLLSER